MWAVVVKEFRQMRRDRRALALMIVVPLLMLVVFGYAASFDVSTVPTRVLGAGAQATADALPPLFAVAGVDPAGGEHEARAVLRDGAVAVVVLSSADGAARVLVDGSQLFAARAVRAAVATAAGGGNGTGAPGLQVSVLFNEGLDTAAVMIPGIAGMILVFVGTVITSLGMVRERAAGTLEQLAVMPFRPLDVTVGKIAPYFVVAAVDMIVVVVAGVVLFDVPFAGSPWLLALGAALFLLVTLGIGVLISAVSQNSGQAIQLALMTLLPQVLLSGLIFPLEAMAGGIRWIAYLLPLTYFVEISRAVMVRGAGLGGIAQPLLLLVLLSLVVFGLAIARTRRDLAPAGVGHRRRGRPPLAVSA